MNLSMCPSKPPASRSRSRSQTWGRTAGRRRGTRWCQSCTSTWRCPEVWKGSHPHFPPQRSSGTSRQTSHPRWNRQRADSRVKCTFRHDGTTCCRVEGPGSTWASDGSGWIRLPRTRWCSSWAGSRATPGARINPDPINRSLPCWNKSPLDGPMGFVESLGINFFLSVYLVHWSCAKKTHKRKTLTLLEKQRNQT